MEQAEIRDPRLEGPPQVPSRVLRDRQDGGHENGTPYPGVRQFRGSGDV